MIRLVAFVSIFFKLSLLNAGLFGSSCNLNPTDLQIESLIKTYVPRGSNGRGSSAAIYVYKKKNLVQKLFEKNPNTTQAVASTQKVLSAWTAYSLSNLSNNVNFNSNDQYYDSFGNKALHYNGTRIRNGEVVSLRELMRSMLRESSNGAANAVARGSASSVNNFMYSMNAQARMILGSNLLSYFQNPNGLTDSSSTFRFMPSLRRQVSTTSEMSRMLGYISGDTGFMKALEQAQITGSSSGYLYKLGYTQAAGKTVTFSFPVAGCRNYRLVTTLFGENSSTQFDKFKYFYDELFKRVSNRN